MATTKLKRRHVALVDSDTLEFLNDWESYRFVYDQKSEFSNKFETIHEAVETAVLYCLHNNLIKKVGEK